MSSQFVVSEKNIRDIAHNLKNLLKLAEKVNYPFKGVKYPVSLTILNNVCNYFGFSSVKGMSELLANENFDQSTLQQQPINMMHGLHKSNPFTEEDKLIEAHIFIVSLFEDLLNNPVDKATTKVISKLLAYKVNPAVSTVIDMLDTQGSNSFSATKESVIQKASQSVFLYHSQLDYWGTFEKYEFSEFLKGDKNEGLEDLFPHYIKLVQTDIRIGSTESISIDKHLNKTQLRISFNPNVAFLNTVNLQLRKRLLLGMMNQGTDHTQSATILRSIMNNKLFSSNDLPTDQIDDSPVYENESDYLKDPKYVERVLRALCWANSYILKKLKLSNTEQDLSHYLLDSNGLLTPKHFPTVYLGLFHEFFKQSDFHFSNMNQLYWAIQLLSAEILLISGSYYERVAAKYIRDVYSCFNFSAVVDEHVTELATTEFGAEYQKFRDSTFKYGFKAV